MKNKIKNFLLMGCVSLALGTSLNSCQDYLDKEADSTVSENDAFVNFRNFQGYVEEIYNCIPDKEKCNWCPSWNWGDDEIFNPEADGRMTHQVDLGNFRAWQTTGNWLYKDGSNPTSTDKFNHSLWPHAWYCIRKANQGLANLDKLVASKAEKDLIAGQLYFFRAWWHTELMQYFGGLPYIDTYLDLNSELNLPRLSYQKCAEKAAADYRKAADLLPINWDNEYDGAATQGKNDLRINKIMALGYLGKTYLWAASPLMKDGAQVGASKNGKTYDYDEEFAKKAAEVFGELLTLVEGGARHSMGWLSSNIRTSTIMSVLPMLTLASLISSIPRSRTGKCLDLLRLSSVVHLQTSTALTGIPLRCLVLRLTKWLDMTM